jgi:UDP:flavonoid glycosyltransferase YjiC (YdhE family)
MDRHAEVRRRLGVADGAKLIMVTLGGVPTQLNLADWPRLPGVYWIVPAAWDPQRRDTLPFEALAMNFVDVLRSADALITKPGYGSFVEAACNGIPVLYAPRHDWPEEACLVEWLNAHGRCIPISRAQLEQGDLTRSLEELFALPPRDAVAPAGIAEAAAYLATLLGDA